MLLINVLLVQSVLKKDFIFLKVVMNHVPYELKIGALVIILKEKIYILINICCIIILMYVFKAILSIFQSCFQTNLFYFTNIIVLIMRATKNFKLIKQQDYLLHRTTRHL